MQVDITKSETQDTINLQLLIQIAKDYASCFEETETDTDTETDTEIAVEPEGLDFTQTSIAASAYTYPAKAKVKSGVNPEYIDSTQTVSETITKGTPVKSPDNLVTVTPQSDGLFIHVDYNATPESMYWKHNSVRLQNVTDNSDIIEISELSIEGTEAEITEVSK